MSGSNERTTITVAGVVLTIAVVAMLLCYYFFFRPAQNQQTVNLLPSSASNEMRIVSTYAVLKYQKLISNNTGALAELPLPENARMMQLADYWRQKEIHLLGYGLEIIVRKVTNTADGQIVIYNENVSRKEQYFNGHQPDSDPKFSYSEEIHRATIMNGTIVKDEFIEIGHLEFDELRMLPEMEIFRRVTLKGDPYGK